MQLHEALGRLDKLPLHENTTVSAVELGKFIDDAVSSLRANPDEGATWYKYLDGSLGIAIGWEDGYDTEDGYEIAAKICNLDSDFMKDFSFLTMPYNKDTGDVWDTLVSNPSSADASWFIKQLNAISDAVDKGELVTEGVNVNKHSSRRRSLTERGLTKAERHNRDMEKISNNYKAQQEKYKKFLASKGVSKEDIDELDRNSGLHGNALGAKAHKMASADEWNKLHESKKVKRVKRIKEDLDTIDPEDIYDVVIKELDSKDIDHYRSDLYVRKTPESTNIINKLSNKSLLSTFRDNIDKDIWYELPLCYTPYFNESLKSKRRKIIESINKINKILRRLNEAPMSDEDREDTQKLRALADKINYMDGRQKPSKHYTQDDLDIAKKYNLELPQQRGDTEIYDADTQQNIGYQLRRGWQGDNRNTADWVRKNKERSIEDDGYGRKSRRYTHMKHPGRQWTTDDNKSALEQDRERDADRMSQPVRAMGKALDKRRGAQNILDTSDDRYEKDVQRILDNTKRAIKDADDDRKYRNRFATRDKDSAQKNIDDILAKARNRNKNESMKLREAPSYDLSPKYDSRKSFYGKARVDTGDKNDQNKLYSYNTLVAEIKNGKPVVYGTYSATTLRHIKDWLKQNGFKAESSKQIMADYGINESFKRGGKKLNESFEDIRNEWENMRVDPVFEFDSGDYYYVGIDFDDGVMYAGSATNVGIIREFEINLDESDSLYGNLERLYDYIIESNPELLG